MEDDHCLETEDDTEEESAILISHEPAVTLDNEQTLGHNSPLPLLLTPPKDRFHFIYFIFVFVGVGILIPWNTFILSIDYFRFLYPTQHVENVIPYMDLIVTLLAVLVTLATVNIFPIRGRIGFGYVMFFLVLLFIPLLDIGIHNCTVSTGVGFGLTVFSVVFLSIGGGVQQSSYYGLGGMLPSRYTQALLLGESVSGLIVSALRVITKVSTNSLRAGAIAFFTIGLVYVLLCVLCQVIIYRSKFIRYYMQEAKHKVENENNNGAINEMKAFTGEGRSLKDWHNKVNTGVLKMKDTLVLYFQILKRIWKVGLSTFLTMFVTLLLFPGLTSDIQYCKITDWPPVIFAVTFNFFDTISRVTSLIPYHWNPNVLILISFSRFIIVPLLVLCVSPSPTNSVLPAPLWIGLILVAILGTSGGYFATVGMMQGPLLVPPQLREMTGNIMAFFLLGGLTAGAIFATVLTPLTELQSGESCSNITAEFLCSIKHNSSFLFD